MTYRAKCGRRRETNAIVRFVGYGCDYLIRARYLMMNAQVARRAKVRRSHVDHGTNSNDPWLNDYSAEDAYLLKAERGEKEDEMQGEMDGDAWLDAPLTWEERAAVDRADVEEGEAWE